MIQFKFSLIIFFLLTSCLNKKKQKEETFHCGTVCGNVLKVEAPAIFKAKCATCHTLYKTSTGPKLFDVFDKIPNEHWFSQFIRNEDSLANAEDSYTLEIKQWSPVEGNHNYKDITDEEIQDLKNFIRQKDQAIIDVND